MNILYLPKQKGEKEPFLITDAIRVYMQYTWYRCGIICAPGFRGTTVSKIRRFLRELSSIIVESNEQNILKNSNPELRNCIKIGILRGMGRKKTSDSDEIISDIYSRVIDSIANLEEIVFIQNEKNIDHRKMMIFFEVTDEINFEINRVVHCDSIEDILKIITPKAVLIGSSNQSYTTYYGGDTGIADKGEADVLMFDDENVYNAIRKEKDERCKRLRYDGLLAKSEDTRGGDTEYMKGILENLLKDGLDYKKK